MSRRTTRPLRLRAAVPMSSSSQPIFDAEKSGSIVSPVFRAIVSSSRGSQSVAEARCAAALPGCRAEARRGALPDEHGLALIGDGHNVRGDGYCRKTGCGSIFDAAPDRQRILLDPTGLRNAIDTGCDARAIVLAPVVEEQHLRVRGALINREDMPVRHEISQHGARTAARIPRRRGRRSGNPGPWAPNTPGTPSMRIRVDAIR